MSEQDKRDNAPQESVSSEKKAKAPKEKKKEKKKQKENGDVLLVVECLPRICEAINSSPSPGREGWTGQ